jgi:hypothetical protein
MFSAVGVHSNKGPEVIMKEIIIILPYLEPMTFAFLSETLEIFISLLFPHRVKVVPLLDEQRVLIQFSKILITDIFREQMVTAHYKLN